MIAFRTTALALACVSATALAGHGGHGGHYDDLGYGHGSLYGYGIGGMSYGLNYGRPGGYGKALIGKAPIVHGRYAHGLAHGHGGYDRHALNFGGYERDVPAIGIAKGYDRGHDLGHYGGGYGAGYAVGYGKGIAAPVSEASIAIGKGYGDLSHAGGYGTLAGYGEKILPPIVKQFGGTALGHGYGAAGLGHGYGAAGLGHGYGAAGLGHGYGYGAGLGYGGAHHGLVRYGKGLTAPLTIRRNVAAYGDDLGYGASYAQPFVSAGHANYAAGHGTPVYSGIVKAGVPVSLAHRR